ncbi:RDD family protein [Flavicella sp.]|uniref:RDD family protein n=1 Tax=Flavicella sp. TaxID=2957742 RepID=UPI003018CE93
MSDIQITTTQNVNINFKTAELGERILAWFIDAIIKYSYVGLVIWGLDINGRLSEIFKMDDWSIVAIIIMFGFPFIIYTLFSEVFLNGQTIGKRLVKIQVVKIDGFQASFIDFFIRWVMRIVDVNMFNGVVAMVSIGSTKKQQRLGGIASGTAVISKKNKINIDHTILQEIREDYVPTYLSVIKLSDNDVRIVKEYYELSKEKQDKETILKIKEKIINVIGENPVSNSTPIKFIETVLLDYNYFTKNM